MRKNKLTAWFDVCRDDLATRYPIWSTDFLSSTTDCIWCTTKQTLCFNQYLLMPVFVVGMLSRREIKLICGDSWMVKRQSEFPSSVTDKWDRIRTWTGANKFGIFPKIITFNRLMGIYLCGRFLKFSLQKNYFEKNIPFH